MAPEWEYSFAKDLVDGVPTTPDSVNAYREHCYTLGAAFGGDIEFYIQLLCERRLESYRVQGQKQKRAATVA